MAAAVTGAAVTGAAVTGAAPLLKVRTVTCGLSLTRTEPAASRTAAIERAAAFIRAAEAAYTSAGFEVQTTRIAVNSFEEWCDVADGEATLTTFRQLDATLERLGVGLFNAGPATTAAGLALVPSIVALGPRISASGALADPLDVTGASRLADTILRISTSTPGGEGNFQFCASFNVPPGIPFFPAAYHRGETAFAIGCETSALLDEALPQADGDLPRAQQLLTRVFEQQMRPVEEIARSLASEHAIRYDGIDASVAPLGTAPPLTAAFESLGLGRFGQSGTLAVASLVTAALKAIGDGVTICGYSGLMLPPCEDAGLAQRASESPTGYRIHDLLAYSAVCGLGLDTVPIPGDVPQPKLAALLLDVAALAFRLGKPLTARLFPVPGKAAGEMTEFANPILCNTRVFDVP